MKGGMAKRVQSEVCGLDARREIKRRTEQQMGNKVDLQCSP